MSKAAVATMVAVTQVAYGPASDLVVGPVALPEPAEGEVRVRVSAASVNPADWFIVTGEPLVLRLAMGRPAPRVRVRGTDVSGIVDAVGAGVTRVAVGDAVFGCGDGSFAEYLVTREDRLAPAPSKISLQHAAAMPMAATVAVQALRDRAKLVAGQRVLIIGAAGGIGSFAVQYARHLGAHVTAVCSTRNVERVAALGADRVIDYTVDDFAVTNERFDVILDNAASHSLRTLVGLLTPRGVLFSNNGSRGSRAFGSLGRVIRANLYSLVIRQTISTFLSTVSARDLADLRDLVELGAIAPLIDRSYPLSEAPAALEYVGDGHASGKVLVLAS